jgi:hypothetical protein
MLQLFYRPTTLFYQKKRIATEISTRWLFWIGRKKRRDFTKAGAQWRPFSSGDDYMANINFELK